MNLPKVILLACFMVLTHCFPKNCQTYNPNNYNACSICLKGYYVVNGICVACPSTKSALRQCSSTGSSSAGPVGAPQSGGVAQGSTSSINKAESILANAFKQSSPGVALTITSNETSLIASSNSQNNSNTTNDSSLLNPPPPNTTNTNISATPTSTSNASNPQPSTSKATPSLPQQSPINDLTQIIFKYLPPHCCQFTVVPALACSGCEKDYVLTSNNTCEPSPPSAPPAVQVPQTIPNNLKVASSDPSSVPIVVAPTSDLSSHVSQPVFIPIISTINNPPPQNVSSTIPQVQKTNKAQNTIPTTNVTVQNNSGKTQSKTVMPRKGTVTDPNCCKINPNFSLNKPVSEDNQRCSCYDGFYYDLTKETCQPVNPLCRNANTQNQCTSCYMGYVLVGGLCLINHGQYTLISTPSYSASNVQVDPNCQAYQPDSTACSVCANRYYFSTDKDVCVQVDSSCKTWDQIYGYCTSCYTGYTCGQNEKVCKPIPPPTSSIGIASFAKYCAKSVRGVCSACIYRSFLSNGICLPVSDLCNTFNPTFGYCLSCYSGYELNNGVCEQIKAVAVSSDPNCQLSNNNGICELCSNQYFLNSQGWCQMVSILCYGYNPENGYCLDCISPYTLDQATGQCLYYQ